MNESVRDSHIDSAVYHLLAVLLLEDEAKAKAVNAMTRAMVAKAAEQFTATPIAVAGSDEPAGVYADTLDEPFPLPQFGPGSEAATGNRHYAGEDPPYHPV
jgi:hypothetical protein